MTSSIRMACTSVPNLTGPPAPLTLNVPGIRQCTTLGKLNIKVEGPGYNNLILWIISSNHNLGFLGGI